ncbi:MAG: hypothetical protein ABIM44_06355 [candidate division WOR-3 bacterium]
MRKDEIVDLTSIVKNKKLDTRFRVFSSDGKIIQFPIDSKNQLPNQGMDGVTSKVENPCDNLSTPSIQGSLHNAQEVNVELSINWRKVLRVILTIVYWVLMFFIVMMAPPRDYWWSDWD